MGARHGRLTRRTLAKTLAKGVGVVAAVLLVASAGVIAYAAADLYSDISGEPGFELEGEAALEGVPDIGAMDGGVTFFVAGIDKRPEDGAFGDPEEESAVLNDVNLLVHIAQDHSHVEVVSFPRDMLVPVPECADPDDPEGAPLDSMSGVKINSVYEHGGIGCVVKTVEQLVGVTIPFAGVVQFYGVAALSEAIGGVDVCLVDPIEDDYSGLHLDAGHHTISGMTALAYLRTRHGVGDGSDLGRISSQQAFMASLMRKVQAEGVLQDPIRLYSIAKAVTQNMQLSNSLQNPAVLVSIAKTVQDVDLSKIVFVQYPTAYTDDKSAVVPSESALAVNQALQADAPIVLSPNATGDASFGTVAESPPAEAPEGGAGEAPEGEAPATDASAAPATDAPAQPLPGDVTGQSGAEVRCAAANAG